MSGTDAGGVDWVARWAAMQAAGPAARDEPEPGADRWAHRAERFGRRDDKAQPELELPAWLVAALPPESTLIDIGAGAGRHALWFAGRCQRVIAVEPSPSMRAVMERRAAGQAVGNLSVVAAEWPLGSAMEADVVFSSHVLYGVVDAPAFLGAMSASARRLCVLLLGVRAPSSALDPLRTELTGIAPPPRPGALEALALLHQLGLPANLELLPGTERAFTVGPGQDDLDDLARRVHLPADEAGRARLRSALAALGGPNEDGVHTLGVTGPNALLWWPTRSNRSTT